MAIAPGQHPTGWPPTIWPVWASIWTTRPIRLPEVTVATHIDEPLGSATRSPRWSSNAIFFRTVPVAGSARQTSAVAGTHGAPPPTRTDHGRVQRGSGTARSEPVD